MPKKKNIRLIILIVLAVLSAILYITVSNPISPRANYCEDLAYAKEQYANTDIKARNKFIAERNKHCMLLLSERKDVKDIYLKLENCNILDYAVDASDKFIELNKNRKISAVRNNLKFFKENLDNFNYCPQYADVVTKFKALNEQYNK